MKEMKRFLSLLLFLVMLVGILPAGVLSVRAEGNEENGPTAVVVAASDFQQNDGHKKSDSVMESIIEEMTKAGYTKVDGAIFCGDYSNQMTAEDSNEGMSYVYGNYNGTWGLDYKNIVFVQGNHDPAATSHLAPSGENDPKSGKYGVFVINEDDYGWASGDYGRTESEIKDTAANLKTYLDAKLEAKFDAPIFVASHLPLHYSMRTYNDGDCRYAQYIFDVLNEASLAGLNIIYLYGHNHSQSFENYHGGGAVFYSAGDEILISDTTNNKTHHTETIWFTYLNAGYTGRFDSEDTADPTNTGTVYEIYDDKVIIRRFDADGTHNLKSAGVQSKKYSTEASLYGVNDRVEGSPQTIELNQFETATDKDTGISVTAEGVTGVTVEGKSVAVPTGYAAYVSYDITLGGYRDGTSATVTIPAPTGFDTSKPAVVLYEGAVIATDTNISDGITFTTNHFSVYDVAQVDESYVATASGNLVSTTTVSNNAVSAVESGSYYLIQHAHDTSKRTLTSTTANNGNALSISGTVGASNTNLWYITSTNGNYYVQYGGPNGKYLTIGNGTAGLTNTATVIAIGDQENNEWSFGQRSGNTTYYLNQIGGRNNNNNYAAGWTGGGTDAGDHWNLYKVETGDGSPVTLTVVPSSLSLLPNTSKDLNASVAVNGTAASSYTITWSSSKTDVATVDGNGKVTGLADGTATITATLTYANNQKVNGTVAVNITVIVVTKEIKSITVDPMEGSVQRGSKTSAETGSTLTVTYDDGTTETIPVTVDMLTGTYDLSKNGTYTGLSISYAGQPIENYTLKVVNVSGNDFPTYPEGGSVKVEKTGTGQDFQNTGIARIELSTSGLPSKKGVDVIVMLDTSSSMTSNNVDDGSQTRADALRESLANLVGQLQAPGPDGEPMDIKIAIADFNGYYVSDTNTTRPYNLETTDHLKGTTVKSTTDNFGAEIYTGTGNLTAGAFEDVHDIDGQTVANALNFQSGTNYDYAFDAVYQLGTAIKAANEEDRDLYVIFMSDGGPFQYNYFSTQSEANNGGDLWNHWMTGAVVESDWDDKTHSYFYNPEGKHWMAEAIKGNPSQKYTVIRKDATEFVDVTGDGVADRYMTQVPGLGATMYSIGFCAEKDDNAIKASSIQYVLKNIASSEDLYHTANDGDDLNGIFTKITDDIRYAAQNAYFEDQMGPNFDLQMNPTVKSNATTAVNGTATVDTSITVTSQSVYTAADLAADRCTAEDVGKAYGEVTTLEKVEFTADADGNITATSNEKAEDDDNILNNGVIEAATFFYNTTKEIKPITLANGSTYQLPGETFFWNIGTINEKKFTLSYTVYLTGSMEGEAEGGSYDTNAYATLYYTNWLGNDVKQDVPSPTMAWGAANVSYAFYLVNANGEPVDASGNKVENVNVAYKVTQPVLYKQILLNSGETVLSTVADDVLPAGYTLYDEEAEYTVTVNSGDGAGSWTITGDHPASTYVTGYAGSEDYSNATPVNIGSYDYTHTTVYFAVVWTIGTVPDTVVIDFGLPVDISVLANDMFGKDGTLVGVGETAGTLTDKTGFGDSYDDVYGTATLNGSEVRYTPTTMAMNSYDRFTYAVDYTGSTNPGYYYGTVTVIPATNIYYEDSFLTLESYTVKGETSTKDETSAWTQVGNTVADATQAEDRPDKYSLGEVDANNIYGYDGAYTACSQYSLGSAAMISVSSTKRGEATFTFYGTGFDVISMTSNTTGTLTVQVYEGNSAIGTAKKTLIVDTYYGMLADGTLSENSPEALYQVPVMKVAGLTYGQYTVKITAIYSNFFNHTETAGGYDLYLDAIRIYDPAGTTYDVKDANGKVITEGNIQDVIQDAYIADGEGWPAYEELRNNVISAEGITTTTDESGKVTVNFPTEDTFVEGAIFIDCENNNNSIKNYVSYGPNNELYLAPNQAIAFNVTTSNTVADVQLGIKVGNGGSVTYSINGDQKTVTSATDMYYSILSYAKAGTVVIKNVSGGILSLTNIKVTYTQDPDTVEAETPEDDEDSTPEQDPSASNGGRSLLWMNGESAGYALMSLRAPVVEDEIPDVSEPEATEPEVTEPETTEPVETEPEVTEPDVTEPEVTEPEVTEPKETEPDVTEPEATEPEATEPEETTGGTANTINTIIKRVTAAINWLIGWLRP